MSGERPLSTLLGHHLPYAQRVRQPQRTYDVPPRNNRTGAFHDEGHHDGLAERECSRTHRRTKLLVHKTKGGARCVVRKRGRTGFLERKGTAVATSLPPRPQAWLGSERAARRKQEQHDDGWSCLTVGGRMGGRSTHNKEGQEGPYYDDPPKHVRSFSNG